MSALSWQQLFTNLRPILREGQSALEVHKATIIALLNQYKSCKQDFQRYLFFDESGYTKNLVLDFAGLSNVIVMCWAPAQSSAFHGHEGSKCFVKVLAGELVEQQVAYPSAGKCSLGPKEQLLTCNQVSYIDDSIGLHKVTNRSSTEPAVTLHIYLPAYKKCRIFEDETSQIRLSMERSRDIDVTFYSKSGSQVI